MAQVIRSVSMLCVAGSAVFALGCATDAPDDTQPANVDTVVQGSKGHTEIHTEDDCDPASFGALCAPNFRGNTTIPEFTAELNATRQVAAWEYGGGEIRVDAGQSFTVDNRGGEVHTFSIVANFGGGRVPPLNAPSGNPVAAPECLAGANATNVDIAAGGALTVTTGANGTMKTRGTFKVQCCIHPWMRTTVVIN